MRYLTPLAVFIVLVIFLGIGLTLNPREVPSPFIGKPAPAFTLPQVTDAGKTLSPGDFKGQVALLNVWASWCGSCRQEHPVLMELSKRNLVALYGLDYKDEREEALNWLRQFGNPYAASAFDADGRVGIDLGVYGVPETFVIDRKGIIRHKHTGPITPEDLERTLLPLIRQLQGEPA
jgi:cytochrome c biogenesis protein CcmG/thiol:disulfide interchange protein DsbE